MNPTQPASTETKNVSISFAQQRLWFLDRFLPDRATYNIGNTIRLRGELNLSRLKTALERIVARHDSLRMTFGELDGQPLVTVLAETPLALPVCDLSSLPASEREEAARIRCQDLVKEPFVLAAAPPWRFALISLSSTDHILAYVIHHIISDRWSYGILIKEMVAFYDSGAEGHPQLAELALDYGSFAQQQKSSLQGEVLAKKLAFWRKHLGQRPPVLDLPTDKARPAIQVFSGHKVTLWLPPTQTQALRELSLRFRASLFMTVMAMFHALLARYTQQEEVVVGTFVAGRGQRQLEHLIGLFVNTLAIRTDLSQDPSFGELVKQVRKVMLGSIAHQDLPFEKLVDEMAPTRDLSRSPLVQVAFNFHNVPMPEQGPSGLEMECGEIDTELSRLDLILTLRDHKDQLEFCFEYSTALFARSRIERMANHLLVMMESLFAQPEARLSHLPLLSQAERDSLLTGWNGTQQANPPLTSVYALIAQQARSRPDAIAAVCGGHSLSYREFEQEVSLWANHLSHLGLGPGSTVGICLERSLHMLVAVVAALRQGTTYLPLDPFYPSDRLSYILEDAGVDVLLTQTSLVAQIPPAGGSVQRQLICMDSPPDGVQTKGPVGEPDSQEIAYTIYTSGSTGAPKGVMVPHQAVINFLHSMWLNPGLQHDDVLLAVTTLSFDISVLELLLPLVSGAQVVVGTREEVTDANLLATLIKDKHVTVVQATPATWKLLLAAGWDAAIGLRILCGGEAMPRDMAEQLLNLGAALYNMYGPTETTVWSAVDIVAHGTDPVPVGLPIANTQLHLLDRWGQLLPVGIPGELFIGGDGVTRGYLARPALTAERYLPDPFSSKPGERLYRTGDLCKRREDGLLHFLGRLDHQVKVRGFRIELGEIETLLKTNEKVAQCVAIADGPAGEQRLLAYVVARDGAALGETDLRDFLLQLLPDYMVPSLFLMLKQFPLTPNGKIDRKALPAPDSIQGSQKPSTWARDDFELRLTSLWERLLKRNPIGVDDNFFNLGGHSLIGVRLFVEIQREFGIKLTLTDLFQFPTVAGIAKLLKTGGAAPTRSALVALRETGSKPPLFCVRGLFLYKALADHLDPEQPVYGIYLESEVDALSLGAGDSISTMAQRYIEALRRVAPHGPYYLAGVSFGGVLALEVARALKQEGEEVALVSLFDTVLPGAIVKRPVRWVAYHLLSLLQKGPRQLARKFSKPAPALEEDDFENQLVKNRRTFYRAAIANYVPQPYHGNVTLYRALNESYHFGFKVDRHLGWKKVAVGGFETEFVAGEHLELLAEPTVAILAKKMQHNLNKAQLQFPAPQKTE